MRFLPLSLLLFLCHFAAAQTAAAKLEAEITRLKNDEVMQHGVLGLYVMTADSGKMITEYNSAISLSPASTLKVLTTGAALGLLGTSYTFKTTLEYDGSYDSLKGIIHGNLYVHGSGDPSFGSDAMPDRKDGVPRPFEKWLTLLKAKGIKKIEGSVIGDASAFDENPIPQGWLWSDMGNYYGAGAYGLNWYDNRYRLYLSSAASGDTVSIVRTSPSVPGLKIDNTIIADGAKDDAFLYGAPYVYNQVASGYIPPKRVDFYIDGALPDPPLFCAQQFTDSLQAGGIIVKGEASTLRQLKWTAGYRPGKRMLLDTYTSVELKDIIKYTIIKSDNMYAECLLKTMAKASSGQATVSAGIAAVMTYWQSKGLDTDGLFMTDGSGLSRSNGISTKQLATVMRLATKESWYSIFRDALPQAGVSGSLAGMMKGTLAEKNLRAKSGYISRARGYTGYVKDKNGRMLVFALLANNYDCTPTEMRKKLERVMVAIAELE